MLITGEVWTLAGCGEEGFADGKKGAAKFKVPSGLAFDEVDQSILVCDTYNNKLRRVSLDGILWRSLALPLAYTDMAGDVSTLCDIPSPGFVALTPNRTILVSSFKENKIFIVAQQGIFTFIYSLFCALMYDCCYQLSVRSISDARFSILYFRIRFRFSNSKAKLVVTL
jgi:hypothetical protein